jgi:hypothetical protein
MRAVKFFREQDPPAKIIQEVQFWVAHSKVSVRRSSPSRARKRERNSQHDDDEG